MTVDQIVIVNEEQVRWMYTAVHICGLVADHNDLSVSMMVQPCPLLTIFSSGFSPFALSLVSSVIGTAEITDILLVPFISLLGGLNLS